MKSLIASCLLLLAGAALATAVPGQQRAALADRPADSSLHANARAEAESLYTRGLAEMEQGNYQAAADLWLDAPEQLNAPDFRIGQALIRMAARQKMKPLYRDAVSLYLWSMEGEQVREESKPALNREVELLQSIVGYATFRDWSKMVDRGDPKVYDELRRFWKSHDPTPMTPYNERLVEHWERVAYADEHYNNPGSKGMDDRADTYLRYGEPDVKRDGQLMFDSGTVNSLLSERMTQPFTNTRGNPLRNFIRGAQQFNMETQIRSLHDYPRYEVWIYERLTSRPENTIFIFGTGSGSNRFQRMSAVEDFIPSEAFSQTDRNQFMNLIIEQDRGQEEIDRDQQQMSVGDRNNEVTEAPEQYVTPAIVMQIMYYQQLAALDEYFGSAYNKMINRYTDKTVRLSRSLAREFESINGNDLIQLQSRAPEEASSYARHMSEVPMELYAYRFLDEENHPYVRLYVKNDPSNAVYYDHVSKQGAINDELWKSYTLQTGFQAQDASGDPVVEQSQSLVLSPAARTGTYATFRVPYELSEHSLVVSSELHQRWEDDSTLAEDTPFTSSLKGLGKQPLELPESLDLERLEMGDLVLGYTRERASASEDEFVPFTVAHDKVIPEGTNFNLYYEVYHLERNAEGRATFTFTYTVESKKSKGFLFFGGGGDELSITLNNETLDSRYSQVLDIETSGLETGAYTLKVEIEDQRTGQRVERSLDFQVQ